MTKLHVIELKDREIVEENGDFIQKVTHTERCPLFFNNRSLLVGKQTGILEKGLEQELFSMLAVLDPETVKSVTSGKSVGDEDVNSNQLLTLTEIISVDHMKDIIWLAYVGAQKDDCLNNDDFKEKYDEDFATIMKDYMAVLTTNFKDAGKENKFKQGLGKSLGSNKDTKK